MPSVLNSSISESRFAIKNIKFSSLLPITREFGETPFLTTCKRIKVHFGGILFKSILKFPRLSIIALVIIKSLETAYSFSNVLINDTYIFLSQESSNINVPDILPAFSEDALVRPQNIKRRRITVFLNALFIHSRFYILSN